MQDYGYNPLGNGFYELVPSNRVVDAAGLEEFKKLRGKRSEVKNDCLGLSWDQIEAMQGGKLKRNI